MTTRIRAGRGLFIASGILLVAGVSSAQVTPGTVQQGELVGDPSSPFAGAFPYPSSPRGNPFWEPGHPDYSFVERQAMLGKALFWDEQLSMDSTMACGTCHAMTAGGTDGRVGAFGQNGKFGSPGMFPQSASFQYIDEPMSTPLAGAPPAPAINDLKRVTELTAPSMINAVFFRRLFWQHRAGPSFNTTNAGTTPIPGFTSFAAPESLVAFPPVSPTEMGHDNIAWASGWIQKKLAKSEVLRLATVSSVPPDITWLLGQRYDDVFDAMYGPDPSGNPVTRERISMSIAQYMRTLISDEAPLFLDPAYGGLEHEQIYALEIMDRNGCFRCHSSSGSPVLLPTGGFADKFDSMLSDGDRHDIGLPPPGDQAIDPITGTLGPALMKTPSMLNLGLRNRFFHSGQIMDVPTLLAFYNQELPDQPRNVFDPPLTPDEKVAMFSLWTIGFTDPRVANETYPFDRPDLHSERLSALGSTENRIGAGTPGGMGVPAIISTSPATASEPWFKAGVHNARPGVIARFGLASNIVSLTGVMIGPTVNWSPPIAIQPDTMGTWWEDSMPLLAATPFIGATLFGQWQIFDPSGLPGYTATPAARYLIQ